MKFTIGTDAEFPLTKKKQFISAIPLIKGTKEKPDLLRCGSGLQRDNVALEFATPVATNEDDFVKHISNTLNEVTSILPQHVSLLSVPSAHFPKAELLHPEAKEFACSPDFNAWEDKQNEIKEELKQGTLRSFAAHVHVGHEFLDLKTDKENMIYMMDYIAGQASVLLDNSDAAKERRILYGKAGAYRPTDYGIEYRTLSNYWLKSPLLVRMVYNMVEDALNLTLTYVFDDLVEEVPPVHVREAINNGDHGLALTGFESIRHYLSHKTNKLFDQCMSKIQTFDMMKEWSNVR